MSLRQTTLLAASLYACFTLASPAPQGPVIAPKPPTLAVSVPVTKPGVTPGRPSLIATPIIATPIPVIATPTPIIDPIPSSFLTIPSPVTPGGLTSVPTIAPPPSLVTSLPSIASISSVSVSVPPIASAMVSSALSVAPSVTAIPGLPTGLPIPSLGLDALELINSLSQSLQILELIISLLQTLAKTGEVIIPGIGPVGVAVEGVLIRSLLELVKKLIPTPNT